MIDKLPQKFDKSLDDRSFNGNISLNQMASKLWQVILPAQRGQLLKVVYRILLGYVVMELVNKPWRVQAAQSAVYTAMMENDGVSQSIGVGDAIIKLLSSLSR